MVRFRALNTTHPAGLGRRVHQGDFFCPWRDGCSTSRCRPRDCQAGSHDRNPHLVASQPETAVRREHESADRVGVHSRGEGSRRPDRVGEPVCQRCVTDCVSGTCENSRKKVRNCLTLSKTRLPRGPESPVPTPPFAMHRPVGKFQPGSIGCESEHVRVAILEKVECHVRCTPSNPPSVTSTPNFFYQRTSYIPAQYSGA